MEGFGGLSAFRGHQVVDCAGKPVGRLTDIQVDAATKRPKWAQVEVDALDSKCKLVPLVGASPSGQDLRLDYDKQVVITAPSFSSFREASIGGYDELRRHYWTLGSHSQVPKPDVGPPPDWP